VKGRPLRHPVSSLSLGPGGRVQVTSFAVTGLLYLAGAAGLAGHDRDGPDSVCGYGDDPRYGQHRVFRTVGTLRAIWLIGAPVADRELATSGSGPQQPIPSRTPAQP
jgi:hypothetical protein